MDDLELLNRIFEETLTEQEGLPFVARFREALHAKRAVDFNLTAASAEQYDEVERIVRALTLRFRLTSLVEERRRAAQLSASAHPAAAQGPGSFNAASPHRPPNRGAPSHPNRRTQPYAHPAGPTRARWGLCRRG
ncbi:MAG: hypothetical protein ACKOQO_01075 [Candidatus Limnocylindrus sp.]